MGLPVVGLPVVGLPVVGLPVVMLHATVGGCTIFTLFLCQQVYGFNPRQRRAFYNCVLRFGMPPMDKDSLLSW